MGEKMPSLVPLVMPFFTAHSTAAAQKALAGTSRKLLPLTAGEPAAR